MTEWRCGISGRKVLSDDTGAVDGEWKRLTMLSDEQVSALCNQVIYFQLHDI